MSRYKILDLSEFPECISLTEYGKCTRLNVFYCQGKKCSFKRTPKEDIDSIKCSYQRLSRLNSFAQSQISKKYFSGSMPWNENQSV